jgi:hypothetical protein
VHDDAHPALWDVYLAKKTPVPMYINSGDDDDFFIEAEVVQLYELLRRNRQPAELRIVDGVHVWPVWEGTIGDAMQYIFRFSAACHDRAGSLTGNASALRVATRSDSLFASDSQDARRPDYDSPILG